jgi:TRAP-type C4-dicarboxylate transport system substrate-binding protein
MIGASIGVAVLALTACAAQGGTPTDPGGEIEPVTVRFATHLAPEFWETVPQIRYAEAVEKASDGLIDFEFHYSESLVKAGEFAGALSSGVIDMAAVYPTYTPAEFPIANWASRMGMVPGTGLPAALLSGNAAQMEWATNEEALNSEFESQGLKLLSGAQFILMFDLLCNEPVTDLASAAGKKVRVAGETWAKEAENLGMVPVFLTGAEIYEGLQRGVVDCAMVHPSSYKGLGLWEIATHYTAANFTGWNSYYLSTSTDFWDGLSAEAQQIFIDQLPVLLENNVELYVAENREFFTEAEAAGVEFHTPEADMQQKINALHEKTLEQLATEAPAGLSDPAASVESRLALQAEWDAVVADLGYESVPGWAAWMESNPDGELDLAPWVTLIRDDILASRTE